MQSRYLFRSSLLLYALLSGCAVGPNFTRPTPPAAADAEAPRSGGAGATRAPAGGVQLQKRVESFVALVNERPEVGLGVAFVGGLILASILKRLAR